MAFITISPQRFKTHSQTVSGKSFIQSLEMADLLTQRGFNITYIAYEKDNDIKVSALLQSKPMMGGLYMEIYYGPLISDETYLTDFYKGLLAYAKSQKAIELVVKPYQNYQTFDSEGNPTSPEHPELIQQLTELGFQHDGLRSDPADWHYVKDMTNLTEASLLNSYSKKGRSLIKKVRTFGMTVRQLKREELHIFKDMTTNTSERRGFSDKPLSYYEYLYDSFGDAAEFMLASINFKDYYNNLSIGRKEIEQHLEALHQSYADNQNSAKYHRSVKELTRQLDTFNDRLKEAQTLTQKYGQDDVALAASLFIYTPEEVIYFFSGSLTEFNKFYAPAILQDYIMTETVRRGIPSYNFLGIQGIFDGSDGVLRFKQNFNGYITRKMGTFRYYPRPLKYKVIQGIKKLLGR